MIIQMHSPLHTTDLKRALDQLLLLLVEQDVSVVSDVYVNMTMWSGDKQVEFVDKGGQPVPLRVEPYPDRRYWMTTGPGEFHSEIPKAPIRRQSLQQKSR